MIIAILASGGTVFAVALAWQVSRLIRVIKHSRQWQDFHSRHRDLDRHLDNVWHGRDW